VRTGRRILRISEKIWGRSDLHFTLTSSNAFELIAGGGV
jgi:hypothetical protein